jgi:hypothetical protein
LVPLGAKENTGTLQRRTPPTKIGAIGPGGRKRHAVFNPALASALPAHRLIAAPEYTL